MKKFTSLLISLIFILLTGCSANDFEIKLSTPKSFTPDQATPIQMKILDREGKPVEGAKVSVDLDMQGMSHGDISMKMEETGKGMYVGQADFEMEGDYTAAITIDYKGEKWLGEKRFSIVYNKAQ
ncbi:FixH family protein [Neobacillus sp. MER 74]|uniref:FixH family protein n=1 Tax=Neobacillus sp. MER 74 TaxID=2939566 RepID=UPI00203F095F|nr:FixH family protein [Neobacillus sp. MER 74]MCM3116510.1 FixH family protein [Neobacillus sp. MER 74]